MTLFKVSLSYFFVSSLIPFFFAQKPAQARTFKTSTAAKLAQGRQHHGFLRLPADARIKNQLIFVTQPHQAAVTVAGFKPDHNIAMRKRMQQKLKIRVRLFRGW